MHTNAVISIRTPFSPHSQFMSRFPANSLELHLLQVLLHYSWTQSDLRFRGEIITANLSASQHDIKSSIGGIHSTYASVNTGTFDSESPLVRVRTPLRLSVFIKLKEVFSSSEYHT
ncbi:hypothetical protein CDAR_513771 [Caerostris darwini]|uniref:Uncharacterized protein n=1 Tax=Caerostris darwini TaxID=1538125 RepID=A0AAV4SYB4_9ARAC|nr:hypothetical protein CDAR_513771 [Caerostris darwini]